jgi:integrase
VPRVTSRLYRRPNSPFWWAAFTTPDGGTVRQSTGCRDQGAAQAWLATRELERVRGEAGIPIARPVSLEDAAVEYLAEQVKVWSSGWYDTVQGFLANDAIPHFGAATTLSAITREQVSKFRAVQIGRVSRRGKVAKPIGSATVNRMMAALARFGEWGSERGYLVANPFAKHAPLHEEERPPPEVETAQLDALLAALPARWSGPFTFAADTGVRKSELERLDWTRVNLREGTATLVGTKNRKKARTVVLTGRARAVLEALPHRVGLVFGSLGDPRKALTRAAKEAGIERVWPHAFRHFWATRMSASGTSLRALMEGGGWTTPRMVTRYAHAHLSELKAAAARLEAVEEAARNPPAKHTPRTRKKTGGQDRS